VVYTSSDRAPKKNAAWLTSDDKIKHAVVVKDDIDDEDEGDESWTAFSQTLGEMLDFVVTAQRVCALLCHFFHVSKTVVSLSSEI
jgi:hypothetical protein